MANEETIEALKHRIYYDDLTGFKNRTSLVKDLDTSLMPIIFMLDIDSFHSINELYGVQVGNEVLTLVADMIKGFVEGKNYEAYRVGGDKFVLVEFVESIYIEQYENDIFELYNLIDDVHIFIDLLDDNISVDLTIGIAFGGENALSKAEAALKYAKANDKKYVAFSTLIDTTKELEERIYWQKRIKQSIKDDGIVPVLHPIYNRNGEIAKYEVLMRMKQVEENGVTLIPPFKFLSIAVKTKQYAEISKINIFNALHAMAKSKHDFSLNFSYIDIKDRIMMNEIKNEILKLGVANRLIFEITESEDIKNYAYLESFIDTFREIGVRIAIDDFGSGFSNFTQILKIRPDYIKIDGSIVKDIDINEESYILTKAITTFSKQLGMKVIAEFISSEEIYKKTYDLGIDEFQGFYFSEPLQIDDITA
jgi:diguanylate cyclase (GGDEF)-like protein